MTPGSAQCHKVKKSWTSQKSEVQFFVTISEKVLDKQQKMCGLFANCVSKKALVIRSVPHAKLQGGS